MNCNRCPHLAAIHRALRPCQSCEAGKLHGQVHVDDRTLEWATGRAQRPIRTAADADRDSDHGTVTRLDADAEDALRKAMASLFSLDPIELLLVQHVIHGGSYASFSSVLLPILHRLRTKEAEMCGKKDGFRSLAHTWAKKIDEKMPQMADVLRARIDMI